MSKMHEEKEVTTKPQSTTEETLEPCPFCGSKPETGITGAPECDNWRYVKCSNNYCSIRYSLFTVKSWNTRHSPAGTAPVVDEGPQKMFPPPAEDKLHIAICNAVQSNQFTASDILRQALLDYQPTQLTRSELIRVQQRSGSDEVSAIMVSPAAATAAPVEQSAIDNVVAAVDALRNQWEQERKRRLELYQDGDLYYDGLVRAAELIVERLRGIQTGIQPAAKLELPSPEYWNKLERD